MMERIEPTLADKIKMLETEIESLNKETSKKHMNIEELIEKYNNAVELITKGLPKKESVGSLILIASYREMLKDLEQLKAEQEQKHTKEDMINFHINVMEKGLESEASEYKKSEWNRLVKHQAEQCYKQEFKNK